MNTIQIEFLNETQTLHTVLEKNKLGESIKIQISKCDRLKFDENYPLKWLLAQTYVIDSEGNSRMDYNPMVVKCENGLKVVDEMVFEATKENEAKLINMILKLFFAAEGKSATEIKMEKIYEYAKTAGVDIVYSIPEGWKKMHSTTNPFGTERINNGEKYFININGRIEKNPKYKEALLIY